MIPDLLFIWVLAQSATPTDGWLQLGVSGAIVAVCVWIISWLLGLNKELREENRQLATRMIEIARTGPAVDRGEHPGPERRPDRTTERQGPRRSATGPGQGRTDIGTVGTRREPGRTRQAKMTWPWSKRKPVVVTDATVAADLILAAMDDLRDQMEELRSLIDEERNHT